MESSLKKPPTSKLAILDDVLLNDFHGGIHPLENKLPASAANLVQSIIAPELHLALPVTGSQLQLHCKVGEKVLKGQLLASDKEHKRPPSHASTSGYISAIEEIPSSHPSGIPVAMITMKSDGLDQWLERQPAALEQVLKSPIQVLIDKIFTSGITGMGGAGFPTATKLETSKQLELPELGKTLLLNGAECEPYISCDDLLMQTEPTKLLLGAKILGYCIGAEKIQIAVEDNKPLAIASLREKRDSLELAIGIIAIPTKYPSGGEKQLIEIVTGKQVQHGKFPAHLGITVLNLATTTAVYDALVNDSPLIERIVTVSGENLKNPANYKVLLGTPIRFLLQQAGFNPSATDNNQQIIMGGPMMGHNLNNLETPVLKTTNCILVPSSQELPSPPDAMACIRCGLCTEVCPAQLLPQQLYWHSRAEEWEKAEKLNLLDCIECGACSYVCPSHIPLVEYYRFAKVAVNNNKQQQQQIEAARMRHDNRQNRLNRLQQEKADRRKQKAAEALIRKQQRQQQDGYTEDLKTQSVADAVARVKAKKLQQAAELSATEEKQNHGEDS
jgi:electron transport complex protein RnfC